MSSSYGEEYSMRAYFTRLVIKSNEITQKLLVEWGIGRLKKGRTRKEQK
jgi:hypothetical protein